jgi:hypothetical protein
MLAANNFNSLSGNSHSQERSQRYLRSKAVDLFNSRAKRGKAGQAIRTLLGRPVRLASLNDLQRSARILGRHHGGLQEVSIDQIRGSEGRVDDFDASFYPLHERTRGRWMSVAEARLSGLELPPVELIQIGDTYYVRDGHHRISVAKALGAKYIDAQVTVWNVKALDQQRSCSFNPNQANLACQFA